MLLLRRSVHTDGYGRTATAAGGLVWGACSATAAQVDGWRGLRCVPSMAIRNSIAVTQDRRTAAGCNQGHNTQGGGGAAHTAGRRSLRACFLPSPHLFTLPPPEGHPFQPSRARPHLGASVGDDRHDVGVRHEVCQRHAGKHQHVARVLEGQVHLGRRGSWGLEWVKVRGSRLGTCCRMAGVQLQRWWVYLGGRYTWGGQGGRWVGGGWRAEGHEGRCAHRAQVK